MVATPLVGRSCLCTPSFSSSSVPGSPSTVGVAGVYTGQWAGVPHGFGTMDWENGITYVGEWAGGRFHGAGKKLYSRGGGYVGGWREGKRSGWGASLYGGKWGNDRWVGPFEDDFPHGVGTMHAAEGSEGPTRRTMAFVRGEPVDADA